MSENETENGESENMDMSGACEKDSELDRAAAPYQPPSLEEVNKLLERANGCRYSLLSFLSNEKATPGKQRLRDFIISYGDVVNTLSRGYIHKVTSDSISESCSETLSRACKRIEKATENLSQLATENVSQAIQANNASASYAGVAARMATAAHNAPTNCVSLGRGKAFPLNTSQRVIIGPREENFDKFANSKATKETLQACINPTQLKLKVKNVRFGPNRCVLLEGEQLNVADLRNCQSITDAGLEIKPELSSNPRLIIHDIPVNLERDEIIKCISEQNLSDTPTDDLKIKYLYPAGIKKFRSCIVEMSPEHRLRLLSAQRVIIGWNSCRVDDHVSIVQCYKCMGFGHLAKACNEKEYCGFCAGEHLSKDCKSRKNSKCINCHCAKNTSTAHSAMDKSKCVILRKKIEQKIPFVNYGS